MGGRGISGFEVSGAVALRNQLLGVCNRSPIPGYINEMQLLENLGKQIGETGGREFPFLILA